MRKIFFRKNIFGKIIFCFGNSEDPKNRALKSPPRSPLFPPVTGVRRPLVPVFRYIGVSYLPSPGGPEGVWTPPRGVRTPLPHFWKNISSKNSTPGIPRGTPPGPPRDPPPGGPPLPPRGEGGVPPRGVRGGPGGLDPFPHRFFVTQTIFFKNIFRSLDFFSKT